MKVRQGNVHGIETTFLAMDTEEGVEVTWNEVHFTDQRVFRIHEENIKLVFEQYMQLDHPNIVKFHKYWIESGETPARKTSAGESHTRESHTRESHTRESHTRESHTRESHTRESPAAESSVAESHTRESHTRESHTRESPAAERPAAESPAAESPAAESPAAESPAAERPEAESPAAERPAAESPAAESPAAESPAAESPAAESPAAERPAAERPAAESHIKVIFITEYMSSGSLKQFVKKTKTNDKTMHEKAWRRWCTQILSALSYLHSWEPPLIHGTLTCDTIFIQHNGLIKIGAVWHRMFINVIAESPRNSLRSPRVEQKIQHFFAPEYGVQAKDTTALDIFAFGICALEMAVLEMQRNPDNSVPPNSIPNASQSLENPLMKEFIQKCLARDPSQRPSAHDLLFHRVLFEVHSLKLLAAHSFINNQYLMQENCVEEMTKRINRSAVMAEIRHRDRAGVQWTCSHVSTLELDKFLEDVKNGIHPLMNFSSSHPLHLFWAHPQLPETTEYVKSPIAEAHGQETRKVIQMQCQLESHEDNTRWRLILSLKLDDRLHRHLTCDLLPTDDSWDLALELVQFGFINQDDCQKLATFLEDTFRKLKGKGVAAHSQQVMKD
ncbi:nuclear receptor-binding protein 2-like [Mustelus asterias]